VIDKKIHTASNEFEIKKQAIQANMNDILGSIYTNTSIFVIFDTEYIPMQIAEYIQKNNIHYVLVCTGMYAQEKLLVDTWKYLPTEQKVV
jgi:hypothetical protein